MMVLKSIQVLGRIFVWFLLIALASLLNGLPLSLGLLDQDLSVGQQWLAVVVYLAFSFAIIYSLLKWYFNQPDAGSKSAQFDASQWKHLFLGWGTLMGANILFGIFRSSVGLEEQATNQQIIVDALGSVKELGTPYLTVFMIGMVILAPLAEELVFRGLGSKFVFRGWPTGLIAFLTSVTFGYLHVISLDLNFILSYSVMGYIFYRAFARRNNIWDSIWLHMLNNAFAFAIILLLP
ncbi:CPBP family intramembrane glutamic endopeptidase [Streptococcus danieliae]